MAQLNLLLTERAKNMLAFLPDLLKPASRLRNSGRTELHGGRLSDPS